MLSIYKYLILSVIAIIFLQESVFSQKSYQNIEKVTLVTDRNLYLSGEPIWFSAMYTIPEDSSVILSKVLYLELFNNDRKVVTSQKISISRGVITGQLKIPEHVTSGYYTLRAYTRYQENFPTWQLTSIILSIVNPTTPLPSIIQSAIDEQVTIATMADGNLAFNIEEPTLSAIDSVKLFVNEIEVPVQDVFYSNGLGRFNHKVGQDEQVHLLFKLKSGDTIRSRTFSTASFPVEVVTNTKLDKLELNISGLKHSGQEIEVSVLNLLGDQSLTQKIYLINDHETLKFPLSEIGRGLLLISISGNNEKPIFESFCFVEQENKQISSVITDSVVMPGDPVYIDLSEVDNSAFPIAVSFVMQGTHSTDAQNLPRYLVNNPLYIEYFLANRLLAGSHISDQINIALALNRQKMLKIIYDQKTEQGFVIPELYGLTLQGKLTNPDTQEPLKDELVYCSLLGDQHQFHATRSTSDGSFVIPLNFLYNQHDLYVSTNNFDENASVIIINNGFCPASPIWTPSQFVLDTSYKVLVTQMHINYQIINAFSIDQIEMQDIANIHRPVFGNNLTQVVLADYIQLSSTPEVFNEIVPNVRVRERDDHFDLVMFDDNLNLKYDNPLVLVDQVPYNDIDKIMELQATQIEQIDVATHVYAYGNNLFNGIVIIKTNTGNFAGLPLSKGGVFVEYEALNPDKYFVPFSSLPNTSGKPNFVNTVYWKSFDSVNKPEQILITAPNGIADYELLFISLKSEAKIVGKQKIRVRNALLEN